MTLPAVFQQLQELDDKRVKQIENYIRKGVEIERSVFPIINKCLDGILRAADSIDPQNVYQASIAFIYIIMEWRGGNDDTLCYP